MTEATSQPNPTDDKSAIEQKIDWKADSRSFNRVVEDYDTYRPGYPSALVDFVLATSGIPKGGRILEIGSGPGNATRCFAGRGYSILGLEPGANLVERARQNFAGDPLVSFENTTFEDWETTDESFDLIFSAQAWHWIDKSIGYSKAARLLKPEGWIAPFWNLYPFPIEGIFADLQQVYDRIAPHMNIKAYTPYEQVIAQRESELANSGCFGPVTVGRWPWSQTYTTQEYMGLLNTYSDHLRQPEDLFRKLKAGIAEVIEKHGGKMEKPYMAVVFMAKRL